MPATEQTWRNQRTLHVFFGVSALVMAVATVVMMMRDHNREWKQWQLKDRHKDAWMIESRRDALADQYSTRMDQFEEEIRKYDSQAYPPGLIDKFKTRVRDEDNRVNGSGDQAAPAGQPGVKTVAYEAPAQSGGADEKQFEKLDRLVQELSDAAAEVDKAQTEVDRLQAEQPKPAEN